MPINAPVANMRNELAWPAIAGIDAIDVRRRFGDRPSVFLSLLARFLSEFSDTRFSSGSSGVTAFDNERMHKLRGAAAMLGAKTLQNVAAAAEAACLAGEVDRAAELAVEVSMHIRQLGHGAGPVLANLLRPIPAEPGHDGPLQRVPGSVVANRTKP